MINKKDFTITDLISLVSRGKYEVTNAGFAVIDKIDRIRIDKPFKKRKVTVQVLDLLSENKVKYAYVDKKSDADMSTEEAEARLQAMPSGKDDEPGQP